MMAAEAAIGCDPLITYTVFTDVTPRDKTERADVPWSELVGRIVNAPTYISKAACPLISLAEYGDTLSDAHCIRHAANVRRIFGIEFDYDGEQMPPDEAAALLANAHLEAVLYTSPSHTPDRPRWRVLLPLSEPSPPEHRALYVGRVNRVLRGGASRESFTLSQSFYIGRVRGAPYVVIPIHGRPVDLASELEPLYFTGAGSDGKTAVSTVTDAELRERFRTGDGRYEAMLSLSSRWAARGMSVTDIAASLRALLEQGNTTKNADGIDLLSRVDPMATSAVAKFGETRRMREPPPYELPPVDAYTDELPPTEPDADEKPTNRRPMRWRELATQSCPPRQWFVRDWLHPGVTLFSGKGGLGKSLIGQTIASLGAAKVGAFAPIEAAFRSLTWACEDAQRDLWERQDRIAAYLETPLGDFEDLGLTVEQRLGMDNCLYTLTYGAPTWTPLYKELREQVNDYRAEVLFLDNISQTFGGNENDRHHVTAFVNGLIGLVPDRPFAIVLYGHVAKAAGSEFSGSSAWENAVRMRWFLGKQLPDAEKDDDAPAADPTVDDGVRYLCKRKSNYSTQDYVRWEWRDGLYIPDAPKARTIADSFNRQMREDGAKRCVLGALEKFVQLGIRTTEGSRSPDYLPRQIRDRGMAQDYTPKELARAMNALRMEGRIVEIEVGQYANRTAKVGLGLHK